MRYDLHPSSASSAIAGYGWANALSRSFIVLSVENPPAYGAASWRTERFVNALALFVHRRIADGVGVGVGTAEPPMEIPWDFALRAAPMTADEADALRSYWVVLKGAPTALSPRQREDEPYRVYVVGAARRAAPALSSTLSPAEQQAVVAERWTDWMTYFILWTIVSVLVGVYLALVNRRH